MDTSLRREQVFQVLVYLGAFLLLWEWLRPVTMFTNTGNLAVFVIYAAFCFFVSVLQLKWWAAMLLKLFGLLFILDGLFISETFFSPSWFQLLFLHIEYNVNLMFSQEWLYMTPLFRSLLFLLLLWLLSYLLHYWFVVAKRVFIFILLTFIYLTVVDTFTNYQANAAIVRTFIISLLIMGTVSLQKEVGSANFAVGGLRKISVWIIPLIAVIFLSTMAGFAAPKLAPQWPDPVPYLTSMNSNAGSGGEGSGGVQRVGYGVDDSHLGGAFIQDYTPVFQAVAEDKHYWRIETKDFYTGKGWEVSTEPAFQQQPEGNIAFSTFHSSVETEEMQAFVDFEADSFFSKVVYPYGVSKVEGDERVDYLLDEETGTISVEGPEQPRVTHNYRLEYDNPSFSITELEETTGNDPAEITSKYLQLPEALPQRVKNLSSQVVKDAENRYDKAKAVEQYFSQNGFAYQIEDVAVPGENQDYVDQFLFETKRGYCDNFSTSMVVMLRSLDIPARWVKGFTGGELMADRDAPEDMNFYQVTNANAHSWVEVYFPEVGWVPFEPTQGFSNPMDFYMDLGENQAGQTDGEQEEAAPAEDEETETPLGNNQEMEDISAAASLEEGNNIKWWTWMLFILGAGGLTAFGYYYRYSLLSSYFVKKYKKTNDAATYQRAYLYLLKVLKHKGMERAEGQTLREYAFMVDRRFGTSEMSRLTYHYERIIYRGEANSAQWSKMTESWENLIKRALS